MVKAIPEGYHSVTPYLVVNNAGGRGERLQFISINIHLNPEKFIDIVFQMEKVL
jgi:hypothetical protein